MSGWPQTPIGELVKVRGGGTPKRDHAPYFQGDIPWVTPKDMKSWKISSSQISITKEAVASSAANIVPEYSVLLVVRSGVLKHTAPVAIATRPVAINQDMKALECNSKLNPDFLARFLKHSQPTILSWVKATTADNYSIDRIKSLTIPVPPLDEQRRIAAILDQADALRRKRREAMERTSALREALFDSMFGAIAQAENNWPVRELREVVRDGTIITYGMVQAGEEFEGGVPYIRTGDIANGEILTGQLRRANPAIAAKFDRARVQTGDIVMSIRATVGTTAMVPPELDGANLTQGTAKIAPGAATDGLFLLDYLRSASTQNWIARQVKGATFREITLARLRELPVVLPPLEVQQEFSVRASALSTAASRQQHHLAHLDALFASLQHRAFRGEL